MKNTEIQVVVPGGGGGSGRGENSVIRVDEHVGLLSYEYCFIS